MTYTPESIRAAGSKIIAAAENGELQPFGRCQYEDNNGKCCAIGYLLQPEQRQLLKKSMLPEKFIVQEANRTEISDEWLLRLLGGQNAVEEQLGMPLKMAAEIQSAFDGMRPFGREEEADSAEVFIMKVARITNEYYAKA